MRELKFRAWSNTDKEYNYKVLVGNSNSKDENYTCHSVLVDGDWLHFDEFCGVIEQYTGLKDKNGNEIYEGDIVKMSYGDTESLGVCKWTSERSRFVLEDVRKYPEKSITELFSKNLLVIGNIHENPELLEVK